MPDITLAANVVGPAQDMSDGLRKAAMLMLVIGDDHARLISDRLAVDEMKMITQEIAELGRIRGSEVEALLQTFNTTMGAGAGVVGTYDTAKQLLSRILDEDKVALIMKDIGGPPGGNVWEKLSKVDDTVLASFLKNEYPQTIAVVLSKIRTDHAARVMSHLPEEVAIEAMMRMLRLDTIQDEIMTDIEDLLRVEFMANATGRSQPDHHEVMAEIFNFFDRTKETTFLTMLEERNKESAELIRSLMFTFDDLAKLDGQAVQLLLRNVDNSRLGLALKGGKDELQALFFSNMSERAAKILREDMENMGPVRVKDVEEAQSEIVIAAKALLDSGEISITAESDEDMISLMMSRPFLFSDLVDDSQPAHGDSEAFTSLSDGDSDGRLGPGPSAFTQLIPDPRAASEPVDRYTEEDLIKATEEARLNAIRETEAAMRLAFESDIEKRRSDMLAAIGDQLEHHEAAFEAELARLP